MGVHTLLIRLLTVNRNILKRDGRDTAFVIGTFIGFTLDLDSVQVWAGPRIAPHFDFASHSKSFAIPT